MISYADVQNDLVPRFPRDLTASEEDQAPILIEDASFWLGAWVPGLPEAIAAGDETLTTAAKLLVVAMVKRSLLAAVPDNPGVQSVSEVVGPFQQQITYRNPEGNLYLYERELADITALLRTDRAAAVSIRSPGL